MNELRVGFTQQQLWPAIGGGEIAIYRIAKQVASLGVQVTIFTTDLLDLRTRTRMPRGTEELGLLRIVRQRGYPLGRNIVITPALPLALCRTEFDLVHAHGFGYFHAETGGMVSAIKHVPLVFSTHGFFPLTTRIPPALSKAYTSIAKLTLLRRASRILVDSEAEGAIYARFCARDKIVVLPNESLSRDVLSASYNEELFRDSSGIDSPYFLCLGRITESKGFQNVVRAFPYLSDSDARNRVKVVFMGPDRGYLEKLRSIAQQSGCEKQFAFVGAVEEGMKFSAMAGSLAVIVPSFYETYGIVITEAMALGVPVVATRFGGASPRITHLRNGFLADPRNPAELAEGMNWALNLDRDARRTIGEHSRSVVESGYTVESVAVRLRDLYMSVMS